ncbi:MAG: fucose isomerase [Candidatus Firestonebacteria bacterium]|nr:fucose isomerase [Candidatus Firestonebacteria bacterium]
MMNAPEVKIGLVAVSRDCFSIELSKRRRDAVFAECKKKNLPVVKIETIIENEKDTLKALEEIKLKNINALSIYLGNFGPEGPTSILAQRFKGPVMLSAAAEESTASMPNDRGDAYCGMLNASYNFNLRHLLPYVPEYPVGTKEEIAAMIAEFISVARTVIAVKNLKIFAFGPRPQDFLACNAPIKGLYDLGVEVMENSELDLYDIFKSAEKDPKIPAIVKDMEKELGKNNTYPDLLKKQAQYEAGLLNFMSANTGSSKYTIFANKCWPSFEKYFGFVPCYINSRLAGRGIPVSCEVDIYGALSEYMASCATEQPATLLDINNSVPMDMYKKAGKKVKNYTLTDLFMGFHCGNTASCMMDNFTIKFQKIMHSLMEKGKAPDITRGTLEGTIKSGDMTLFRLQSSSDTTLKSYVAEGEILNIDPNSFGSIAVFAVKEMGRFYRHVLIGKQYPHHCAVVLDHAGKPLFSALKMLGIKDISFNQPNGMLYKNENPF